MFNAPLPGRCVRTSPRSHRGLRFVLYQLIRYSFYIDALKHLADMVCVGHDAMQLLDIALHEIVLKLLQMHDVLQESLAQVLGILFEDRGPHIRRAFCEAYGGGKSTACEVKNILLVLFNVQHSLTQQKGADVRKMGDARYVFVVFHRIHKDRPHLQRWSQRESADLLRPCVVLRDRRLHHRPRTGVFRHLAVDPDVGRHRLRGFGVLHDQRLTRRGGGRGCMRAAR